jgi:RNA polymerase sigma-70 factor (ECF subfamily)
MNPFRPRLLLLEHLPALRRLAIALCRDRNAADDLLHDTVARAIEKAGAFTGGDLRGWLVTVMLNLFRGERRRFARLPAVVALDDVAGASPRTDDRLDIVRALDRLADEQRIAILLLILEGRTYAEIARLQGVPIGTVMSRIARAREAMQDFLAGRATNAKVSRSS